MLGSLILPRLSDIYGRRKVALFGNILHIIAAISILLTTNFRIALFLIFMMGVDMGARVLVGYVFMSENIPDEFLGKNTIFMFSMDALGTFISSLFFLYASKDWRIIFGIPLLPLSYSTYMMYK